METLAFIKKARDEVQALTDGSSTKLSSDVIGWIRRDMGESSDYNRPMMLAAQNYPDLSRALDDARRGFNMMGFIDAQSVGGRLFIEKVLSTTLNRLNGMLYTLGEQDTPYTEDEGSLSGYNRRKPGPKTVSDDGKTQTAADMQRKTLTALKERLSITQKSLQSDAWLDQIFEQQAGIKGAAAMLHTKNGELEKKLAARSLQQRALALSIQMMTTRKKVI